MRNVVVVGCCVVLFAVLLLLTGSVDESPARGGKTFTVSSTAYCPGSSGSKMADGSRVFFGAVANNFLPFGTKIKLLRPRSMNGKRIFQVRDHIGAHSQLDFWVPSCGMAFRWGRRTVTFQVMR